MISLNNQVASKLPFHVMIKPRGAICNLECDYCYYLKKKEMYPNASLRMDDEILEIFIKDYISSQETKEITFAWQGGEPTLMGLDFYKKAVKFQEKYNKNNQKILNTFQTNAFLITEEWARFFKSNDFLLGISIDGPQNLHDKFRRDKKGNGTFNEIMEKLKIVMKHQIDYNILTCVNSENVKFPLEVYHFLRDDIKADFIQFIPIVNEINQNAKTNFANVSEHTVLGTAYGNFLIKIFDDWVSNDVGQVFVQIFDSALASWMGYPAGVCVFDKVCGKGMALEFNGDVYSCDHFVTHEHFIGNIKTQSLANMLTLDVQQQFGIAKWNTLTEKCRKCDVLAACYGGCPKNRIVPLKNKSFKQNYLCSGYKKFFTHIKPYMKIMGEELKNQRSASNIVKILKNRNSPKNATKTKLGRNDPCYCGSGKKYKKCHGN